MQSVKKLAVATVLTMGIGTAFAAPTTELPPAPAPVENGVKPASDTAQELISADKKPDEHLSEEKSTGLTMQEHLNKMVEEDYVYQSELRELKHKVEVEKMLGEIRKLRGEDKLKPAMIPTPVSREEPEPEKNGPAVNNRELPHVVLESVIGGLSRVAVTNESGGKLLYVKPGESFSMDGQQYILTRDKKAGLQIKEVNP